MATKKAERIKHLIAASAVQRDQLEAMAFEFVEMHDVARNSSDEDDLMSVILDGEPYKEVIARIIKRRAKQ